MSIQSFSNPFYNCWDGITHLFAKQGTKEDEAIKRLSQDALVNSLALDMQTGSDKIDKLLQKTSLATLVQKTGLSEVSLVAQCQAQQEIVEGRDRSFLETKVKKSFLRVFPDAVSFFNHLIDTALKSLGLYEIGGETIGTWGAISQLELYMKILSYPSVIFLAVSQVATVGIAAAATAAIVIATLLAIGVYIRYLKPCPEFLRGFANLTTEAKRGLKDPVFGRDTEIAGVLQTLENKQGVRLLGTSGAGKSELVRGIAQKIVRGEAGALNKKQLFSINAADLYIARIAELKEELKGYELDVVLFIDEIHAAWKSKDQRMVDSLKTLIDLFPYCIVATTYEDYKKYMLDQDSSINRRLLPKDVHPMDREHTKIVLSNLRQREAPDVHLEKGVIEHILDVATKGKSEVQEPASSKALLRAAIKSVDSDPENRLKNDIAKVEQKIEVLQSSYAAGTSADLADVKETARKMQKLRRELTELKEMLRKREESLAELKKVRALWNQVKDEILSTNVKEQTLGEGHRKWLINSFFVLPALEKRIDLLAASKELKGIKTKIDKALIGELVSE